MLKHRLHLHVSSTLLASDLLNDCPESVLLWTFMRKVREVDTIVLHVPEVLLPEQRLTEAIADLGSYEEVEVVPIVNQADLIVC